MVGPYHVWPHLTSHEKLDCKDTGSPFPPMASSIILESSCHLASPSKEERGCTSTSQPVTDAESAVIRLKGSWFRMESSQWAVLSGVSGDGGIDQGGSGIAHSGDEYLWLFASTLHTEGLDD